MYICRELLARYIDHSLTHQSIDLLTSLFVDLLAPLLVIDLLTHPTARSFPPVLVRLCYRP